MQLNNIFKEMYYVDNGDPQTKINIIKRS